MNRYTPGHLFRIDDKGPASTPEKLDALIAWANGEHLHTRASSSTHSSARLGAQENEPSTNEQNGSEEEWHSSEEAAQAEAYGEAIAAFAEGAYDGNEDQFLEDIDSIQSWDNPQWEEPYHCSTFVPDWDCNLDPNNPDWECIEEGCFAPGHDQYSITNACPTPCILPATWPSASHQLEVQNELTFIGDYVPHAEDLLSCAWALIEENKDLVQWIACTLDPNSFTSASYQTWGAALGAIAGALLGPVGGIAGAVLGGFEGLLVGSLFGNDADCLLNVLDSKSHRIEILDSGGGIGPLAVVPDILGGIEFTKIQFNAGHPNTANALEAFSRGGVDRDCASAYIASILIHEISHICLRQLLDYVDDFDDKRECKFSDVFEASFMWALHIRYSHLRTSECCGGLASVGEIARLHWWHVGNRTMTTCPDPNATYSMNTTEVGGGLFELEVEIGGGFGRPLPKDPSVPL